MKQADSRGLFAIHWSVDFRSRKDEVADLRDLHQYGILSYAQAITNIILGVDELAPITDYDYSDHYGDDSSSSDYWYGLDLPI